MPEFKERDVRHLNLRAVPSELKREAEEPAPRSWRDLIAAWLEGVASGATAAKVDDQVHAIEEPVAPEQIQQLTEALATWTKGRGSRERGQTPPQTLLSRLRRNSLREVLDALAARPDLRAATLAAADPEVAPPVRPRGPRAGKAEGAALWRASERRAATLYRRAAGARTGHHDDPAVQEALARCGTGEALPAELRTRMERELGVPLGRVRIHTDGVAAAAADAVDAEAFTVGEDVFFAAGRFDPQSTSGRALIAHELVHVVQSWQGRTASKPAVSSPSDPLEREAATVAAKTVETKTVDAKRSAPDHQDGQQYGGGGAAGQTNQAAAAPGAGAAGRATREMFQISSWSASAAGSWYRENEDGRRMSIISQGIHASASVRATTPEAQHYNVGFVQTIHSSTRQAFYQADGGAVANSFVVRRGRGMDQRTDFPSPAPWYNGFVHGAASAVSPAMDDFPRFRVPLMTPDGTTPAHHLGGTESFTTYLVAMQGNDAHTIIYLGNVAWNINWAGPLQTSGDGLPPNYEFAGGHTTIGPAQQSATGGASLSGTAANHGSQGSWAHGGGGGGGGGGHAAAGGGGGGGAAAGGGGAANHGSGR